MYKRFTLDELTNVNTGFFDHLKELYTSHQHTFFKGFLEESLKETERVYFFKANKPLFRIQIQEDGFYRFVDELEKIELMASTHDISIMHNLFKNNGQMKAIKQENKTILDQLINEFQDGQWNLIDDRPFVVYDIETTFDGPHLHNQYFEMAYSLASNDNNSEKLQYKYIDRNNMQKYCDYLLNYEGRIIGYNQVGFDNPVLAMNCGYGSAEIEILNKKSLDPFLFLWKLLGKRMSLNNVAAALVSSSKTLSSGKEGEELLKEYKKTKEQKLLNKVKKYCKNDVHITLGVMLSLLKHKKIYVEDTMHTFNLRDLLAKGARQGHEDIETNETASLL